VLGDGRNTRVLNGDVVWGLEAMDWMQRFAIFLEDAKPPGPIR
jgi:hypothetical protein